MNLRMLVMALGLAAARCASDAGTTSSGAGTTLSDAGATPAKDSGLPGRAGLDSSFAGDGDRPGVVDPSDGRPPSAAGDGAFTPDTGSFGTDGSMPTTMDAAAPVDGGPGRPEGKIVAGYYP